MAGEKLTPAGQKLVNAIDHGIGATVGPATIMYVLEGGRVPQTEAEWALLGITAAAGAAIGVSGVVKATGRIINGRNE